VRADLDSGRVEIWGDYKHGSYTLLGFDSGSRPLIYEGGKLKRLVGPKRPETIGEGYRPPDGLSAVAVSDAHGTWMAAGDGSIWLLDSNSAFRRVAQAPLPPEPTPSPAPGTIDYVGPMRARLLVSGACE
jgi:hypothetical protein